MMLKNAVNYRVQDHQKEKHTTEVTRDVGKVHLTIMVTNAINNQIKITSKEKIQEKLVTISEKSI